MYRTTETSFWSDPIVKKLTPNEKLLFLYLWTNDHSHLSCIYYLPAEYISKETGITVKECRRILKLLEGKNRVKYDSELELVWVINGFRYQGKGPKNNTAAAKHLEELHGSYLISEFLEVYPHVKELISDTLSDTLSGVENQPGIGIHTEEGTGTEPEEGTEEEEEDPYYTFYLNWNRMATDVNLPTMREITPARRKVLKERLKNKKWLTSYLDALFKIMETPFLLGENDRKWKADVDWFLRPDTVTKILEGKYGGKAASWA